MSIMNCRIGQGTKISQPELVNIYNSKIGNYCSIATFVEIGGSILGDQVKVEAFTFICPGVIIEDEVFIGPRVTFTNDKRPKIGEDWQPLKTIVQHHASIGAGVTILPGITIGPKAMIGAGSVVTKDVGDSEIWFGVPAGRQG